MKHAQRLTHSLFRAVFTLIALAPCNSVCAEMIHRWSFAETSGTTVEDSVGDADGVIVILTGGAGHQLGNGQIRLDGGRRGDADYVQLWRGQDQEAIDKVDGELSDEAQ